VVTINTPLHPETEHMFNDGLIGMMKRGSYIVNTARGKICDRDAIVHALESGQLAGCAGDVWFPQPAWRTMPHHGMTPHISGTSLSAQTRYAAGTREILESLFRQEADPHRGQGQARRCGRPLLYRGRRHQGLRRGGEVQGDYQRLGAFDSKSPGLRCRRGGSEVPL
jgi:phosphoglycerate dehydrogenase-like enzyme